jgi:putative flavoprotein involved in K+ transport
MNEHVEVAVVGGSQSGLALGYFLAQQQRRFVILEGSPAIGDSWSSRYDSLRLFTPAQYNSLPGLRFPAPADYYPTKDEVADYLRLYARTHDLPVRLNTPVRHLRRTDGGYEVRTESATYTADQVVVATGHYRLPHVPAIGADLDPDVMQIHSSRYRNPGQFPDGPVLVVGAGNSGAQIVDELSRTRQVTVAMGQRLSSLPQRFLGRDLFWWLTTSRLMDATVDSRIGQRMRRSDTLIGTNLTALVRQRGVRIVGRAIGARGRAVTFADGQPGEFASIVWATGYRPDYSWIEVPVFDEKGHVVHRRGVTSAPGLFFLGMHWQHTRGSSLLGFVGRDAAYLSSVIAARSRAHATPPVAVALRT